MKNIKTRNDKGQAHGYWEVYLSNGNLMYKGNYVNDKRVGYWEYYYHNGNMKSKEFYI
jgi:antitoxin component YwqK of YwqJK toxin-antitoxin module